MVLQITLFLVSANIVCINWSVETKTPRQTGFTGYLNRDFDVLGYGLPRSRAVFTISSIFATISSAAPMIYNNTLIQKPHYNQYGQHY